MKNDNENKPTKEDIKKAKYWKIASVALSSSGPCFFMKIFDDVGGVGGVPYFLILGGLGTLLVYTILNYFNIKIGKNEKEEPLPNGAIFLLMALLVLSYAIMFFFYVYSMHLGTITESALIIRLAPAIGIIISLYFLEKKGNKNYVNISAGITLCLIGVIISKDIDLTATKDLFNIFILCAFIATIFKALIGVAGDALRRKGKSHEVVFTVYGMFFGGTLVLIFSLIYGINIIVPTPINIFYLTLIGTITVGFSYIASLVAYGLAGGISEVESIDYFLPLGIGICAYFINGERNFDYQNLIIGFIVISIGIYLSCIKKNDKKEEGKRNNRL